MENQPILGPTRERSVTESGYSEEEQAKVVEGSMVDIKQIKKRKPLVAVDRQAKILDAYQDAERQIEQLLPQLQHTIGNPRHQEKILEEIRILRQTQEELIQCLLLEQRGELSESTASNTVWNLIK